jgi:DMSO reductase family type II enzyme chaperone
MAAMSIPTRSVTDARDRGATAPLRCSCYAVLSELLASPHDLDPRVPLREKSGIASGLEFGAPVDAALSAYVEFDLEELQRQYSGLFEVGDDGPPVPIREDLQTGQRAGTREDLVRFYSFFKYSLGEKFAWAPDHASVELEFMHYLCYHEASADDGHLSYQLAQFDFSSRHLVTWFPRLANAVQAKSPDSIYGRVVGVVCEFLLRDHDWQAATIVDQPVDQSAGASAAPNSV